MRGYLTRLPGNAKLPAGVGRCFAHFAMLASTGVGADSVVEHLFREREARGVIAALSARLTYLGLGVIGIPLTAVTLSDGARTMAIAFVGIAINAIALRWVMRREHVTTAGLIGVSFDVIALFLLPLSWYLAVGGPHNVAASFMAKTDFAFIGFVLIGINALTLRPLYPLIVAAAMTMLNVSMIALALLDERTVISWDPIETHMGPAMQPSFQLWRVISTVAFGLLASAIARVARSTVADAVRGEVERGRILAEQAEKVAAAQLLGLTRLVAGLAHEINSPLGALMSAASSVTSGANKLEARIQDAQTLEELRDGTTARTLRALRGSTTASELAGARLSELVDALKIFARLDQGEWADVDLNATIHATVALVPAELRRNIEVRHEATLLPPVRCRAREIGQVFMTVIENALEAMNGEGQLTIEARVDGADAVVTFKDDGPGMADEVRRTLFDLSFSSKKGRMGMGLGLPVGLRIVRAHQGDIDVGSQLGEGTTVTIRLPLQGASAPSTPPRR